MKKIITIILAALIAFSGITVFAEKDDMSAENIQLILGQLGVMNGYPDGNFYPDRSVTRAEFAKISIMASAYRDFVASGMNTSPFADVSYTHWAAPYVKLASVNKLITGYPDSTFRPENNVLMEEAVTVAVKMLGYNDDDFTASWPYAQIGVATNIGLLDGITSGQGSYLTRGEVARLIYNTLRTKPKAATQSSAEYMNSIGYSIVEDVTVVATANEDSSVGTGKVSTSSGTYKINEYFDYSIVGKKGDILINDSNELILFFGNVMSTVDYSVYSVLEDEIVVLKDGNLVSLRLSNNLTAYYKLQTTTLGSIKASLDEGYLLSVSYDASGNPEYVRIEDDKSNEAVTALTEVYYNVYTILENEIVAYKDGGLVSLKLPEDLTAYFDSKTTTFGSVKANLDTGYLLSVGYDSANEPKYVKVDDEKLEGPFVILTESYAGGFGLSANPVVMKDGNRSDISKIDKYDVVYYSTALDMMWAYSKKITGTYEEAYPSRDSVSSVKIAGTTYTIESAEAAAALSSSGDFALGDTITVMIGKDGEIAGVVAPENVSNNIYGYVTSAGTSEFTDSDGNVTSSRYVQLVHTDGSTVKYKTKNDYSSLLNSTVKLTLSNGIATLKTVNMGTSVKGVFDTDKMMLGNNELSETVSILEVTTTEASQPSSYTTLFLNRLDGINVKATQVLHYEKDSKNRITDLILLNATGDAYKYGIITNAESSSGAGTGGSYRGFMGTQSVNISSPSSKFSVTSGQPVQFTMNGNSVYSITALNRVTETIESISGAYVVTNGKTYKVSDNCVVYNSQNNVMTLEEALSDSSLKYQVYVDKHSSTVRVIKALNK